VKYDEVASQFEEFRQTAERDRRGVQSSLQSQIAELQRQQEAERLSWQDRLAALETKDMDEVGKASYRAQRFEEQAVQASQRLSQLQSQLDQYSKVPQYIQLFTEIGVDPRSLVMDQGVEALVNSGWQGVITLMEDYRSKAEAASQAAPAGAPSPAPAPAPGLPGVPQTTFTPPAVASTTGAASTLGATWPDVLRAVGGSVGRDVTIEDVYRMIETGQLSPSIIPGLGQA
jgi:hypothetical protein